MPRVRAVIQQKPGRMPGFFCVLALLAVSGCDAPSQPAPEQAGRPAQLNFAGQIEENDVDEASGIAASRRNAGVLWVHNDSGDKAHLHAIDTTGRDAGRLKLDHADNDDWEDLAAFELDGVPYLLVADTGDNDSDRDFVTLYVVEDPDLGKDSKVELDPAWCIRFRYPGGPRDAEAVAVDVAEERVLVVSKRDLPARVYALPLRASGEDIIEAEQVAALTTLPPPRRDEIDFAPVSKDWHWQPVAMDISPDESELVLMTYSALYLYARQPGESWEAALARMPLRFNLQGLRDAEAAAFSANGESIFVTVEAQHAPLLRVDFRDADGE